MTRRRDAEPYQVLPDLVIAGVNKAGTTTLFGALAQHPDVGTSDVKETCFFLPIRYGEPLPALAEYSRHFAGAIGRGVVMEATPGYFYGGEELASALDRAVPDVKIVVSLREPVARLLSFFRFQKAMLNLPAQLGADAYVERCLAMDRRELAHRRDLNPWFGVEGGRYADYLEPWAARFGERLRVVFFDELISDLPGLVRSLGDWLGLDAATAPLPEGRVENPTIAPQSRTLHRVALAVNQRLERRLRSRPAAKDVLRKAYARLNAAAPADELSAEARAEVEAIYRPSNRTLAGQLERLAVPVRAPAWLDE